MPLYRWRGLDSKGILKEGALVAPSLPGLYKKLLHENIGLIWVQASTSISVSRAQKDAFFEHLAILLCAHIPLYESLRASAATQKSPAFKEAIDAIASLVAQGGSFSDALHEHGLSDPLCHALVNVGESTGTLGQVLKHYVAHRRYQAQSRSALRQALAAPLITLCMFMAVLCCMIFWVIPHFKSYFDLYRLPLPWYTSALFRVSLVCTTQTVFWLSGSTCGLLALVTLWGRTARGGRMREYLLDKSPLIGPFYRQFYGGHTLKTLGMLLEQGVCLATALEVSSIVLPHKKYSESIFRMKLSVEKGFRLSEAWGASPLACSEVEALLSMGESSGTLTSMILCAADLNEKRRIVRLNFFTALINPLLLVLVAGLIGALAYSLYMPMIELSTRLSF